MEGPRRGPESTAERGSWEKPHVVQMTSWQLEGWSLLGPQWALSIPFSQLSECTAFSRSLLHHPFSHFLVDGFVSPWEQKQRQKKKKRYPGLWILSTSWPRSVHVALSASAWYFLSLRKRLIPPSSIQTLNLLSQESSVHHPPPSFVFTLFSGLFLPTYGVAHMASLLDPLTPSQLYVYTALHLFICKPVSFLSFSLPPSFPPSLGICVW